MQSRLEAQGTHREWGCRRERKGRTPLFEAQTELGKLARLESSTASGNTIMGVLRATRFWPRSCVGGRFGLCLVATLGEWLFS